MADNDQNNKPVDDLEERRESLLDLATLGETVEYLGEELSADKIHKLSRKSVDKYFSIYKLVQGKKVSFILRNPSGVGMKTLFDDYGGDLNREEKKNFDKILKTELYSKLCFSLRHPFHKQSCLKDKE